MSQAAFFRFFSMLSGALAKRNPRGILQANRP